MNINQYSPAYTPKHYPDVSFAVQDYCQVLPFCKTILHFQYYGNLIAVTSTLFSQFTVLPDRERLNPWLSISPSTPCFTFSMRHTSGIEKPG